MGQDPHSIDVRSRLGWPAVLAASVAAIAVAWLVFEWLTATEAEPPPPVVEEVIPESRDAYRSGGRPVSLGEAFDEQFGHAMSELVLAYYDLASGSPSGAARVSSAEQAVLSEDNRAALGADVASALEAALAACRARAEGGPSAWSAIDALNRAFAQSGLGYYIDVDSLDTGAMQSPLLYTHAVDRVRVYRVPGHADERVLWLRRLDKVALQSTLIGSTHEDALSAVIRWELIDHVVLHSLLPALGADAIYDLWPILPSERAPPGKRELERKGGQIVRKEIAHFGLDAERAAALADLYLEREDLFYQLQAQVEEAGYRMAIPDGYDIDSKRFSSLERVASEYLLREIDRVGAAIRAPEMMMVRLLVRNAYVTSVEFHEVQHRLDYQAHRKDSVPPALMSFAGSIADGQAPSAFARRLVTEYSAHMAEIALSELPFTSLLNLAGWVFDRDHWGSTYADVAAAVLVQLAARQGIEHGPVIVERSFDRQQLAVILLELLDLEGDQLRQAAKAAWMATFDGDMPQPVLLTGSPVGD